MAGNRYYLTDGDRRAMREVLRKVRAGGAPLSRRPTPRRQRVSGDKERVLSGLVVGSATAGGSYTVDNVQALAGGTSPVSDPGDQVTVDGALADYVDNQKVFFTRDESAGNKYVTLSPGGDATGGSDHTHSASCGTNIALVGGVYTHLFQPADVVGCGLEVGAGTCDIDVKVDPDGCIVCDDTLGLQIFLDPDSCIRCDSVNGLVIELDANGCLDCDPDDGLGVVIDPNGGIECGPSGLRVLGSLLVTVKVASTVPARDEGTNAPGVVQGGGNLISISEGTAGNNVWGASEGDAVTLVNTSLSSINPGSGFDVYWHATRLRPAEGSDPNAAYLLLSPIDPRALKGYDATDDQVIAQRADTSDTIGWEDLGTCP